jgi:hypothetical protein
MQAEAMQTLRELLTPEVMRPVMALQNNPLGYKTDKREGYDPETVRDVMITALGRGAAMTLNRVNIISGQCYLTKAYFEEHLDNRQGRGRWAFIHGIPKLVRGTKMVKGRDGSYTPLENAVVGAVLSTEVRWQDADGKWLSQTLEHAIKGDDYSTADAFTGKADRKCGAWLLARITGERVPDGDADGETINVTPTSRTESAPAAATLESRLDAARQKAEPANA